MVPIEPERVPQVIVRIDETKVGGHDTNDLGGPVVQLDHAPSRVRIAAKATLRDPAFDVRMRTAWRKFPKRHPAIRIEKGTRDA